MVEIKGQEGSDPSNITTFPRSREASSADGLRDLEILKHIQRLGTKQNSTTTLKTHHQEKTYAMYHSYERIIDYNGRRLELAHRTFFSTLICLLVVIISCQFYFIWRKNSTFSVNDDLVSELQGVKSVKTALHASAGLALWSFTLNTRPLVEGRITDAELYYKISAKLYQTALNILAHLHTVKNADVSSPATTKCIDPAYISQSGRKNCPLRALLSKVEKASSSLHAQLREAIIDYRIRVAEAVQEGVLKRLPTSWTQTMGPMSFTFSTSPSYPNIRRRVDDYTARIENIQKTLLAPAVWTPIFYTGVAFLATFLVATACFSAAVCISSMHLFITFKVCQEAFFQSVEELRNKIEDLVHVTHATFEYGIVTRLHTMNGLAALLLASPLLTTYHHKLLKVMERCLADCEAATVNAMTCVMSEVETSQMCADTVNIRCLVEDCLEAFRIKANAKNIPITCTFSTGCPSSALADDSKLRNALAKVLSFVIDHSHQKGQGIDVYIDSLASSRHADNAKEFRGHDIRFEVKGHGVCMGYEKAQKMGVVKGLLNRAGNGLRILAAAKLVQTMGGNLEILSSPLRGTSISFQVRTRARFNVLDFPQGLDISVFPSPPRILTLGLTPETKRFLSFFCMDIGVSCVHCCCMKQLLDNCNKDTDTVSTLAFFLGDYVRISSVPQQRGARLLTAPEIFQKIAAAGLSSNAPRMACVYVSSQTGSVHGDGRTRGSSFKEDWPDLPSCFNDIIRLFVPVRTDKLIEVVGKAVENLRYVEGYELKENDSADDDDSSPSSLEGGEVADGDQRLSSYSSARRPDAVPQETEGQERAGGRRGSGRGRSVDSRSFVPSNIPTGRGVKSDNSSVRESTVFPLAARHARSKGESDARHETNSLRHRFKNSIFVRRREAPRFAREPLFERVGRMRASEDDLSGLQSPEGVSAFLDEALEEVFTTELVPDALVSDVNAVVEAVNRLGLARPPSELAALAAEKTEPIGIDVNNRAALQMVVSLSASCVYAVFQGRDPLVIMSALACLQVKIPQEYRVQAFFSLASSSVIESGPLSIHELLDWDFHCLKLSPAKAIRMARDLLAYFAAKAQLEVPGEVMMGFCVALYDNYQKNPYHNFFHALNVAQILCLLLALPDVAAQFTPIDYFVLSVAALGHDLGHPGVNNGFINNNNCHARFNVFCYVAASAFPSYRQRIISAILWTDMAKHFDMVAKLTAKIQGEMVLTEGIIVKLQKSYLEGLLLHAADISNPMLAFDYSRDWAIRACDEFYQQNKLEEKLGQQPFMPNFTSFDAQNVAKCQVNFIDFICKPLFNSLALMFPAQLGDRATQLEKNRRRWQSIVEDKTTNNNDSLQARVTKATES